MHLPPIRSLRANAAAREAGSGHIAVSLPLTAATTHGVEEVMWQVPAKRSTSGTLTMEGICQTYAVSLSCSKGQLSAWGYPGMCNVQLLMCTKDE